MPQSDYNVNINITAKDRASPEINKAAKATKSLGKQFLEAMNPAKAMEGVIMGIGQSIGSFAANAVAQIPQVAAEIVNLGVQSEAVSQRFERFAGSTEASAEYLAVFQAATGGAVAKIDAMAGASKMLQMGIVSTSDEMGQMAAMAIKLGDQTMEAGDRLGDWNAMIANQSIPRLDNFGISSGKVRARIDELLKSGQALSRDEAFKMAVLEQGAIALAKLGDTTETASHKMDVMKAALKDAKVGFGELAVGAMSGAGGVEDFASRVRGMPAAFQQLAQMSTAVGAGMQAFQRTGRVGVAMDEFENSLKRAVAAQTDFKVATEEVRYAHYGTAQALEVEVKSLEKVGPLTWEARQHLAELAETETIAEDALRNTASGIDYAAVEFQHLAEETEKATLAAQRNQEMQLSLSMSFSRQLESMQESSANFAKQREQIETEHAAKIAEIQRQGQSKAIRINVEAEQKKLSDLQFAMEQAQRKVDEMSGKEAESTRIGKERTLEVAKAKYAEQQQLLESYSAGTLMTTAKNTDALIAEENRKKDAAIAAIDEQMAKQQQLQEQAMGQLMLQTFDQWSEQKDIPVEKMLEMRTSIAEEYGLVSEGATDLVTDMLGEWDRWASGANVSTDQLVDYMSNVTNEQGIVLDNLLKLTAQEWVIKVHYQSSGGRDYAGAPSNIPGSEPEGFQHGGTFTVGERGPEMVTVQPLSSSTTYNETYNVSSPGAMAAVIENRRRQRRLGFARTM